LVDESADKTGKRILCDGIIPNKIVNSILELRKDGLWWKIEIVEIGMIDKIMAMVTAVLGGELIEEIRLTDAAR
jgi:hypothetical protein